MDSTELELTETEEHIGIVCTSQTVNHVPTQDLAVEFERKPSHIAVDPDAVISKPDGQKGGPSSNKTGEGKLKGVSDPKTSTPLRPHTIKGRESEETESRLDYLESSPETQDTSNSSSPSPRQEHRTLKQSFEQTNEVQIPEIRIDCEPETLDPENVRVPILGFEVMEERSRFTIFKIRVEKSSDDSWFVFRRYTDFIHMNDQLRNLFPGIRLALPPKRWFRDNYDKNFLEDRMLGLQAFLDNVTGHTDICNSKPVREFFCFDDPPGPHDSLEESRLMCENLEECVYNLKKENNEKDSEIRLLKEELELYRSQVDMLSKRLRQMNKTIGKETSAPMSPVSNQLSLPESDMELCPEAERPQMAEKREEERQTTPDSDSIKKNSKSSKGSWKKNFKKSGQDSSKKSPKLAKKEKSKTVLPIQQS